MLTQHELLSVYLGRAAYVAGIEMYFDREVALEFLTDCQENKLAVIGVEGFVLNDLGLIRQPDLRVDYSETAEKTWRDFRDNCNRAARILLEQLPERENLVLSLTLVSHKVFLANRKSRMSDPKSTEHRGI
jgi:hypothetical protein